MNNITTIATLGGHSALEICSGAHAHGFKTLVIVQKGREKTYTEYFSNLVDSHILVDSFSELTDTKVLDTLQKNASILIPHRYFQIYCDLEKIEKQNKVPVFGNKYLLSYEERSGEKNQYVLFKKADIDFPKQFTDPTEIDRLVLVKVNEADRGYERAFYFVKNFSQYQKKSKELIQTGKITKKALEHAIIEEYLVGVQVNFNFFYSPLTNKIELLGTDTRRQTNIDGLIRIPANQQKSIGDTISPSYIESGHCAVTVKESLLENAFEIANRLVAGSKKITGLGIMGPFAIQTAIIPGPPKERIVVYDVSLRMPGSPGTGFTPYSMYHFGESVSFGQRIAMEIKNALKQNKFLTIST